MIAVQDLACDKAIEGAEQHHQCIQLFHNLDNTPLSDVPRFLYRVGSPVLDAGAWFNESFVPVVLTGPRLGLATLSRTLSLNYIAGWIGCEVRWVQVPEIRIRILGRWLLLLHFGD